MQLAPMDTDNHYKLLDFIYVFNVQQVPLLLALPPVEDFTHHLLYKTYKF
jgi:hypothetical protein